MELFGNYFLVELFFKDLKNIAEMFLDRLLN